MLFPGQAKKAAERLMALVGPAQPAELVIARCIAHLVGLGLTEEKAADLAYEVWAARDAAGTGCFFDLSRSTPSLVYLVDPVAGVSRPVTIRQLLERAGPRLVDNGVKSAS